MTVESASPAASKTARKVDKAANGLAKEADRKISAMADRAESAAKRAETVLHDGVAALRSYAETATERLDTARAAVSDKVRERPLTGLLAAAGVGLLLGMLISGRRR